MLSRRDLFAVLLTVLGARRPGQAAPLPLNVDRLLGLVPGPSTRSLQRHYRADATVLLFSVPLLHRSNVGSGTVGFEEHREANRRRLSLRFAAGSLPQRARGLNRLGYLHEVVVEEDDRPREAACFGFITSSPEESFAEAKKAMGSTGQGDLPYTIIDSTTVNNRSRSAVTHLLFPPKYNWADIGSLVSVAREQAHSGDAKWNESTWPSAARSFLYVLSQSLRGNDGRSTSEYVYNEKRYRLTLDKTRDESQAERFAQAGLTRNPSSVRLCKGEIFNFATKQKSLFQVWVEENGAEAPLPLRIEFQPKSYLRLSFEWDSTVPAPNV